ncbi:MFS transporter [Alicyclobacillus sendaiensis]|uniref:MFS transporter n=1 Tax=Alicyclobacillus sendaiensis PA2 TaxID=3029425 RepID=A0ABT6XX61_ALISE|nr:MFS transporter [Alicyclobacillus sendaiensis]MDI9259671.1 MFS transporter [Alicyclobacillus sendaiensis PA2]
MALKLPKNAVTCIVAEPLFVIPYNMYTTYASVYMLQQGLSSVQLGWFTTMNLVVQMISAAVSGYLTDRMGRRTALWVFDVLSWSCATLLWAISHTWIGFGLAFLLNGLQRIPTTAWYCLLTEDTPPLQRTRVFTLLQVVSTVAGFLAPLSGYLVHRLGLVPATRILYTYAFVSMTLMIVLRHLGLRETSIGLQRLREARPWNLSEEIRRMGRVIRAIQQNRNLFWLFGLYVLWNIQASIRSTFIPAYQMDGLMIPAWLMGTLPALSSLVMAICLVLWASRFQDHHGYRWMHLGLALLTASALLLCMSPPRSLAPTLISTALAAAGTVFANPFVESMVANALDDSERSTSLAVLNTLILLCSSPAGAIAGYLYAWHPRSTAVWTAIVMAASMVCVEAARRSTRPTQ